MSVFKTQSMIEPAWWQRLAGIQPRENGLIALENLLASRPLSAISEVDVQQVLAPYEFNLRRDERDAVQELYRRYLRHCLHDRQLSDEEIERLHHLKRLLELNDVEVQQLHRQVGIERYRDELTAIMADGKIDPEERKFLEKLEQTLHLPEDLRKEIYRETATERYRKLLDDSVADKRLSPAEQKKLRELARDLGVAVKFDKPTQQQLERYRLLWQIDQGELPVIDTPIKLYRSEAAHFYASGDWYELRTLRKGVRYSGPTLRIKIAKGLYWRAGQLQTKQIQEDEWKQLDNGTFYLTNKRILFLGHRSSKTLRLNRIVDFSVYQDGLELRKDRGRPVFIQFQGEVELLALLLDRALESYGD